MAEIKKTAQAKAAEDKVEAVAAVKEPVENVVAKEAEKNAEVVKAVEIKEEEKPAPKKRTRKTAEQKAADVKKDTAAKKTTVKKTAVKKAEAKQEAENKIEAEDQKTTKTRTRRTTKAAVKTTISLQFSGKSYGMEDLQKMAEDVWKYDLQKEEAFKTLELYVKPEEDTVYYVFDGEIMGNFHI